MSEEDLRIWNELLPTLSEQAQQDLTDLRNTLMHKLSLKCPDNSQPIGVGGAAEILVMLIRKGYL